MTTHVFGPVPPHGESKFRELVPESGYLVITCPPTVLVDVSFGPLHVAGPTTPGAILGLRYPGGPYTMLIVDAKNQGDAPAPISLHVQKTDPRVELRERGLHY